MDFDKQEIQSVRALLLKAHPYEENRIIGKLYTRELGLISAIWSRRPGEAQLLIPPIGMRCQLRASGNLYKAYNLEPVYSFTPQNQSNNFFQVWWITKHLIEACQGEIAAPALWDLAIKTLSTENAYQDFHVPTAFMIIAFCEGYGVSIEEFYGQIDENEQTALLSLMQTTIQDRHRLQIPLRLFESLLRFVGEKLESNELLKYCERGDLNPHEENLTTTSK